MSRPCAPAAALAGVALLSIPLLVSGALLPPTSSPLTDRAARGNLIEPLEPAQAAGIWIGGRLPPRPVAAADHLRADRRRLLRRGRRARVVRAVGNAARARSSTCSAASSAAAALVHRRLAMGRRQGASPPRRRRSCSRRCSAVGWLDASRPAARRGWRSAPPSWSACVWSNALGYRDVSLAPHDQLAELEQIGERVAGEGPTLMTEYEPYGVRHFLRDSDARGDLRAAPPPRSRSPTAAWSRRALPPTPMRSTRRRSRSSGPSWCGARRPQSRPPSAYELTWRGRYYEVWQRDPATTTLAARGSASATASTRRRAGLRRGPRARARRATCSRRVRLVPLDRAALADVVSGVVGDAADPLRADALERRDDHGRRRGGPRPATTRSGSAGRCGRRSTSSSTGTRWARCATSSTTSAATSASARRELDAGRAPGRAALPRRRPAPGQRRPAIGDRPAGAHDRDGCRLGPVAGRGRRRARRSAASRGIGSRSRNELE